MSSIVLELLVLGILIVINGLFAMSELAVMSARKARLIDMAQRGSRSARTALELAERPNRFLSTVQVGITLIGVLAGAFGGATLARVLSELFDRVPLLAPYSDALGFGCVVLLITYASLVIGELVPKRLALLNPERVAALVAGPMRALSVVAAPVVRLLSASTSGVIALLGVKESKDPAVTEEEIRIMIEEGTRVGVFRLSEQDMVENVFDLDDRRAEALMTPYTEIVWLDVADSPDEITKVIARSGHASLPVCHDSLDNLLGVVHVEDLLARALAGEPLALDTALHPPRFVPENAPASRVVEMFKNGEDHIIFVIDEHGGIQGLVTEHDLLEAIVGSLPSSGQPRRPEAVQRADGSWLLDGLMQIDDLKDLLGLDTLPDEDLGGYQTVGGFIMSQLGHIPTTGARLRWGGLCFEVVDMDGRRVDKVLVMRAVAAPITEPRD
jgi:putative hemolysin